MNNDLISRETLNETIDDITWYHINPHGELTEGAFGDGDAFYKAEDIYNAIDNAPTVNLEKAKESEIIKAYTKGFDTGVKTAKGERAERALAIIDRLRTDGHINNREQGTLRRAILLPEIPQGDLSEKLKDRIEESVCKHCQMSKHCELCEISRVFQIITLTAEEQKGGAK